MLENADALFERGGDARDRLVELLSSLCSKGQRERLKLLVTSEHRLLLETHERFRDGSEVEAKIEPLKPVDASKFLIDKLPRNFTRSELGLQPKVPLTNEVIRNAVQNHPKLLDVIKEGHPGTLVRDIVRGFRARVVEKGGGGRVVCLAFFGVVGLYAACTSFWM